MVYVLSMLSKEFGIFLEGVYNDAKPLSRSYTDLNNLLSDAEPEPEKLLHIFKKIEHCAPKDESATLKRAILHNTAQEDIASFLDDHTQELQNHYKGLLSYDLLLQEQNKKEFLFTAPRIEQYVLFKTVYALGEVYASKNCSKQTFESWKNILLNRKVSETTINRVINVSQRDRDSFNAYA